MKKGEYAIRARLPDEGYRISWIQDDGFHTEKDVINATIKLRKSRPDLVLIPIRIQTTETVIKEGK